MKTEIKNLKTAKLNKRKYKPNPALVIAASFLAVILIGSIFLYLPISLNEGQPQVSYIDALFTSTSCTCVTGLVSVKQGVGSLYNVFGRTIMGLLIQIGGLGVTTFGVIIYILINQKLGLNNQTLVKENWNLGNFRSIRKIFLQVILVSLSFEFVGAILTFFDFYFVHNYPVNEAIGYAIFHSVSAFNNAGFDVFPNNTGSLIMYENDLYLNLLTCCLIFFGGIGYFVIIDIFHHRFHFKKFSLQGKVAITYSLFLVFSGALAIYLGELNNADDITQLTNNGVTFQGALFMSVSSRTAGFTMYDLSKYRDITILMMILLMFIGASPGSAGGGIKTTTFALLIAYIRGIVTNRKPYLFKRSINENLIKKALLIILLGLMFFTLGLIIVSGFEGNANYVLNGEKHKDYVEGAIRFSTIDYAFECMSAFGTVGLSTGLTPYYSIGSKLVLIVLMFVGRIGPLSIPTLFKSQANEKWQYAEGDISVG